MPPNKWDLVLDQKPVPLLEHLLEQVASLLARDLGAWPPVVEAADGRAEATLAEVLAHSPGPPDPRLYAEAFRLTRLDLARDLEALDDYLRHQRWVEVGLEPGDKGLLLFLSRLMAEQLLSLQEATEGRVNRARLLDVLERTRQIFVGAR